MCLATAYVKKDAEKTILAKNISSIKVEGASVILTDILGENFSVEGSLKSADLVNGIVEIEAA